MTIGNRILVVVGILMCLVLGAQSLVTNRMVNAELRESVHSKLDTTARSTVQTLKRLLQSTEADLTIMSAHRAIDNYLIFRSFDDDEGMTENIAELELFMVRVVKAKPQFARIQFVDRDGAVLQLDQGARVERFEDYDSAEAFRRFEDSFEDEGVRINHSVRSSQDGNVLVSVVGIVLAGRTEALIWLEQNIEDTLTALFADASENGMSVVIATDDGAVAARQAELSIDLASALASGAVPDWIVIRQELQQLDWHVNFGIAEAEAFVVIRELILVSAMIFAAALVVSGIVLLFLAGGVTAGLWAASWSTRRWSRNASPKVI